MNTLQNQRQQSSHFGHVYDLSANDVIHWKFEMAPRLSVYKYCFIDNLVLTSIKVLKLIKVRDIQTLLETPWHVVET